MPDRLHRLTRDHTYAQLLVDTGQLQACDVPGSGMRHILTNVLGGSMGHVEVDIDLLRLERWRPRAALQRRAHRRVDDDTIAKALVGTQSSSEACAELVQLALDSGGRDNVTVIVAAYSLPDEHALSAPE